MAQHLIVIGNDSSAPQLQQVLEVVGGYVVERYTNQWSGEAACRCQPAAGILILPQSLPCMDLEALVECARTGSANTQTPIVVAPSINGYKPSKEYAVASAQSPSSVIGALLEKPIIVKRSVTKKAA